MSMNRWRKQGGDKMGEARSADGHFIAFCERSDQKASRVTHARSVRTEYEYGRYIYTIAFFRSNASVAKRLKKKAAHFSSAEGARKM